MGACMAPNVRPGSVFKLGDEGDLYEKRKE